MSLQESKNDSGGKMRFLALVFVLVASACGSASSGQMAYEPPSPGVQQSEAPSLDFGALPLGSSLTSMPAGANGQCEESELGLHCRFDLEAVRYSVFEGRVERKCAILPDLPFGLAPDMGAAAMKVRLEDMFGLTFIMQPARERAWTYIGVEFSIDSAEFYALLDGQDQVRELCVRSVL